MEDLKLQFSRQIAHWILAAERLENFETFASPEAWNGLEKYLGITIRQQLQEAINQLKKEATVLKSELKLAQSENQLLNLHQRLIEYRKKYLRTETVVDFYGDAVNTRTNSQIAAILRACDVLSHRSMAMLLDRLGKTTPPVLTYLDRGLGASILKAGLRLWDGSTLNPAATIKIVHHNLLRPTSLIHEAGHQVAAIIGWNDELSTSLCQGLRGLVNPNIAEIWSSWASEIAADAFAFAHTGYAAVTALHDVLAGEISSVFRLLIGDPHPMGYLRVLLGVEMCAQFFGTGPWNGLANAWKQCYPVCNAPSDVREVLENSMPLLPKVTEITFQKTYNAFAGKSLISHIDPGKVKPASLQQLEQDAGASLFVSHHWIWKEALRLLALSGLLLTTKPEKSQEILRQQEAWMTTLGNISKIL